MAEVILNDIWDFFYVEALKVVMYGSEEKDRERSLEIISKSVLLRFTCLIGK